MSTSEPQIEPTQLPSRQWGTLLQNPQDRIGPSPSWRAVVWIDRGVRPLDTMAHDVHDSRPRAKPVRLGPCDMTFRMKRLRNARAEIAGNRLGEVGALGGIRALGALVAVATIIVQSNFMTTEEFNRFTLVFSVVFFAPSLSGSAALAITRFLAAGELTTGRARRLALSAALVSMALASLIVAVLAVFIDTQIPTATLSIVLVGAATGTLVLRNGLQGVLRGHQRVVLSLALDLMAKTVALSLFLGIAVGPGTLNHESTLAILIGANLLTAFVADRLSGHQDASLNSSFTAEIRRFRRESTLGTLFQNISYRADSFILASYVGGVELESYLLVVRLTEVIVFLPQVVAAVALPRFAKGGANSSTWHDARRQWVLLTAMTGVISLAIPAGLVLFADRYPNIVIISLLLLPAFAVLKSASVLSSFVIAVSSPLPLLWVSIATLAVSICCYAVFIPRFGVTGAASSSAIAYLLSAGLVYRLFASLRPAEDS